MKKFFAWFYEVCIRMSEIGVERIGDGEKYAEWEYPADKDIEKLNKEFKGRSK